MKLVFLVLKTFWEDKWKNIVLMLQIFLLILVFNISVGTQQNVSLLWRITNESQLNEGYYFSLNDTYSDLLYFNQKWEEDVLIPLIKDLRDLDNTGEIRTLNAFNYDTVENLDIQNYNDYLAENMRYPLKKGRFINPNQNQNSSVNEAVISSDLANYYDVGDVVTLRVSSRRDQQDIQFKIVGVLADYASILNFNSSSNFANLKSLLVKPHKTIIVNKLHDQQGHYLQGGPTMTRILFPATGSEDIESTWREALEDYSYIFSIREAVDNEYEDIKDRLTDQFAIIFILILLALSGVGANNFVYLFTKQNEYAIYFLTGLTWRQTILFSTLRNIILITVPATAAYYTAAQLAQGPDSWDIILTLTNFLLSTSLVVLIYILSSIPVYLKMRRQSPIELLRRTS